MTLAGAAPERAAPRVLIVPHAAAGAASGQPFAAPAPDDWLVATTRLPGRESRVREPGADLDALTADVAAGKPAALGAVRPGSRASPWWRGGQGGHSPSAVRTVTRLRERLAAEIPPAALLREPTVRGFAEEVRRLTRPADRATAR
ncbi:phosphopantetheine-binding protein [Streptomyces sp. NPDC020489]|uniref:phosphopantetheine-binding protein n=1 Tax=Streptomyces sp. NPDC020489 TaxID=3365077 RepID=UPI0037BDD37A